MSDFLSGVTINVNGSPATITSATRQADHAVVHYDITPAVQPGDTVTFSYSAASGHIVAESGGEPLGDVVDAEVTNNVAGGPVPLLDLEADTLTAGPVGTWTGSEPDHHAFTASGDARPVAQLISGVMAVTFDGVDDWMLGDNFADNPQSFTICAVMVYNQCNALITKCDATYSNAGWTVAPIDIGVYIANEGGSIYKYSDILASEFPALIGQKVVLSYSVENYATINSYINGTLNNNGGGAGAVTNISNSEPVRLGRDGQVVDGYGAGEIYAVRIYMPALSAEDRATVEAELAARYGVTL